jgi:hypothetical protein
MQAQAEQAEKVAAARAYLDANYEQLGYSREFFAGLDDQQALRAAGIERTERDERDRLANDYEANRQMVNRERDVPWFELPPRERELHAAKLGLAGGPDGKTPRPEYIEGGDE